MNCLRAFNITVLFPLPLVPGPLSLPLFLSFSLTHFSRKAASTNQEKEKRKRKKNKKAYKKESEIESTDHRPATIDLYPYHGHTNNTDKRHTLNVGDTLSFYVSFSSLLTLLATTSLIHSFVRPFLFFLITSTKQLHPSIFIVRLNITLFLDSCSPPLTPCSRDTFVQLNRRAHLLLR